MKIIHIIPSLHKGGAERLVLDICNELQISKGANVMLITFSNQNEYTEISKNINHKVIPSVFVPSISSKDLNNIADLETEINNFEPNIIHTHLWEAEMIASQIKYSECVWFTHFHDNMRQLRKTYLPKKKSDLTDGFEKRIVLKQYKNRRTNFICISNHTLKFAKTIFPKNFNRRTYLLNNAIDFNKFHNTLPHSKVTLKLINIGSFVEKKNQKFAIDILSKLIRAGIKTELTFLGEGPLKKDVLKYAKENQVSDFTRFLGNVNNVEKHLNESTIYLHTATYEPYGLVCLEAMAAGLPVVTLNGKGNSDIINHNENGFIFDEQNPLEFANKIIELYKNDPLYNKVVENGFKTAKKNDIKPYCLELLQLYKAAISEANVE